MNQSLIKYNPCSYWKSISIGEIEKGIIKLQRRDLVHSQKLMVLAFATNIPGRLLMDRLSQRRINI